MNPDDLQHNSPTASDNVRPRPTQSDHDGLRPTLSATRSDHHTMTTSEVVKLFEDSGLPREKRSIERYCEAHKLDCFKDPDEMRYYITRASAEKLIGHLQELQQRHQQQSAIPGVLSKPAFIRYSHLCFRKPPCQTVALMTCMAPFPVGGCYGHGGSQGAQTSMCRCPIALGSRRLLSYS